LGGQTSGFAEGAEVRGLLGRGAKDTACFGRSVFTAVKNGALSTMTLDRAGEWELTDGLATDTEYTRLRVPIGSNGLTASMYVMPDIATVPGASRLLERLSNHVQLRRLSISREVIYVDRKGNTAGRSEVVLWEEPEAELLLDKRLPVPGYETSCRLQIYKLQQRADGGVSDYSVHGIEIRGSRATYMNTMFSQTGHGVGLLRGILDCPYLDELIREFDRRSSHSEANPVRIVRRDRDGLVVEHPFFVGLAQAVVAELRPILDSLEPDSSNAGGSRLRNDLHRAARLLGELLQTDLDELDSDGGIGNVRPTLDTPIVVIPPVLRARVRSTRTLTLLIHRDVYQAGGIVVTTSNSRAVVTEPPVAATPHARLEDVLVTRVRVQMVELGTSRLTVAASAAEDHQGQCELIIHDDSEDAETEPEDLEWKNESMSVCLATERTLKLRAPLSAGPEGILQVRVDAEGDAVVVITPDVVLQLSAQGWLTGRCRVRSQSIASVQRISAISELRRADGRISVTLPARELGPSFDVQIQDISEGTSRGRVSVTPAGYVVKVFARHAGLARYLGPLENGNFRDESSPVGRAVLAECIASVVADYVARRDSQRDPSAYDDIDMIMERRSHFVSRYLPCLIATLAQNG
jgi:CBS domain-containing protein